MDDFFPLRKPLQSQVTIDSVAKPCPSEGFNYPNFRLLNKHARIYLSQPVSLNLPTSYHLFAIANIKGWFVAARETPSGPDLIFSPLEDLRSAYPGAKEDNEEPFNPKRILNLQLKPNIVTFAFGDTRMFVGLEDGHVLVYDTAALFSPGTSGVGPITSTQIQRPALRQIVPNPGNEPGLSDLVAIVGHEKVHLFNMQLESQGGWAATDTSSRPVAASWSPKGKHIAIGLEGGDILTFALTKKSTPNKHLPPTSNALLASLNWLGPGHTFRTSYGATSSAAPVQHIIVLDTKSSTATYFAPDHPYASSTHDQNALVLSLPNWDADSPSNEDHKSLTIVGDVSAVDLEVLGNVGNQWYRQSQENQVSLPLDKEMDDTILLALEADLTDVNSTAPIVYTYLSDGSLQGWHLEYSKPYPGLISPGATNSMELSQQQEPGKDSDMASEQTSFGGSSFGQPTPTLNAFGQSSFGQQTTTSFGSQQTSAFGQTGFGSKPVPATSTFAQSSFGQASTFGSSAFGSTSAFGQPSQSISPTSSFSDVKPATGFGAFGGGSTNAFGGGGSGAFGSNSAAPNAFSGLVGNTNSVFGQGSFGSPASSTASPSHSPTMTREASMSDSTPGFGGLSLGSAAPSDSGAVNSMFGSFGSQATTNQSTASAFGGSVVKPPSGFGAFGNLKTSGAFDKPATTPTANAFATPPSQTPNTSGFGQSGFASSSFGKSGFGQQAQQPAFGKPSLGAGPVSGGFGAFANATTSLANAAQKTSTAPIAGGFGAFASAGPSTFGSAPQKSVGSADTKPASEAGSAAASSGNAFSAFASTVPSPFGSAAKAANEGKDSSTTTSPFAPKPATGAFSAFASTAPSPFGSKASNDGKDSSTTTSPFAPKPATETATRTSVFGTPTGNFGGNTFSPASAFDAPRKSPFGSSSPFAGGSPQHATSPPSSPEPSSPRKPAASSPFGQTSTPTTSPAASGGAFSNLVATPSAFKPASGFGAFGSLDTPNSSPFFKKPEETPPPVSAFTPISSSATTTTTSASATAPVFGAPSVLGGAKSAFAPISPASPTVPKTPATDAFSAFSGSSGGFSAFAQKKTSFSDLLKTGGDDGKDPIKAPVFSTPLAKEDEEKPKERTSVFGTPTTPSGKQDQKAPSVLSAFPPITKVEDKSKARDAADEEKPPVSRKLTDEPSYEDDAQSDQDAEHSDVDSFLSDDQEDGSYQDEQSAEEEGLSESGELVEEDRGSQSPEPAAVPLPSSRSTSATPQPEPPVIQISPSPEADADEKQSLPSPQTREPSTTPPGTPVKEVKSLPGSSPARASSPPVQPFNLGLGRPSTRPTRSSPLANTVLPPDDEEENKPAPPLPTPESPKLTPTVVPLKEAEEEDETDGQPVSKRPKTPPLLSTLGGPASASTTAPLFSVPPAKDAALIAPTPVTFGSGKQPTAAASTGSLFTTTGPSLFGPKPEVPRASTAPAAPTTAPTSIFGSVPLSTSPKPPFAMPPFNLTGGGAPPLFPAVPTPVPSLFGKLSPAPGQSAFGLPSSFAPAQNQGSPFGGPKPTVPSPSIFGVPAPKQPDAAAPAPAPELAPAPAGPTPEAIMEEGMQKECIRLVLILEKEFKELTTKSHMIHTKISSFGDSAGGSRHKADLGDASKWSLGDLSHFGKVLRQYEGDLEELEAHREKQMQTKRELHSNMLKAKTRKEEIARFQKAKNDKEFAKILKSRSLGPELSETQMHLRKSIRAIRDRVQKLESGLQANKKKLAQSTSFKPSFKAPSLDTINRTYRNIEITIEQQSDDVARLASRINKLSVEDVAFDSPGPRPRDARLPNINRPRAYNITPNVAATTAAALNAERSAQRLKKALLAVRKEPLLNVKVSSAPSAPISFGTPKKEDNDAFSMLLKGTTGSLFGEPVVPESIPAGVWSLPPDDHFNPMTPSMPHGRRGAGGGQRKHQVVPLKRSGSGVVGAPPMAAPMPATTFDWGPLPNFSTPAPTNVPTSFVPISPTNFKK